MPDERAFTRRQPNVNPIALELDRLAEQRALATLGRGRGGLSGGMLPRSEDRTATDAPAASDAEIAAELRANAVRQVLAPFDYEPDDPQWGGLEEDEAHQLWSDRLAATIQRYPDMDPLERAAFQQAFQVKGWALPELEKAKTRAR